MRDGRKSNRRDGLLDEAAHLLDHGQPVRSLYAGALKAVIEDRIFIDRDVERSSFAHHLDADMIACSDRRAGYQSNRRSGRESRSAQRGPISPPTSHQKCSGNAWCIRMRLTPSIIKRPMMPMPTGRKATRTRIAIFQKTTEGPDSQTKWRTGGTFLSARRRSAQALPDSCGWTDRFSPDSPAGFVLFKVGDIVVLEPAGNKLAQAHGALES